MASRRDVIKKLMQGAGFVGIGGLTWGAYINKAKAADIILRPPGAIPEEDFMKACIKCGACVTACPYDTLKLATPGDNKPVGTPHFEPRNIPCEMCPDIPCVPVCPSGALDADTVSSIDNKTNEKVLDINKSRMGATIVDAKSCIAFWGIQCDLCYRACPLMDKAIKLDYQRNKRTGKHAMLIPVIDNEVCTGCGLCEKVCVTEIPAIKVLPRDIALGKVGGHYIKGWDTEDENRLKEVDNDLINEKESNNKAMDYLNSGWEDMVDD